jgi:hypothetical protein
VTARDVTARLKLDVWPLLRDRGFVRITDRRARRRANDVVQVLEFRSLGTYLGSAVGATPSSLVVNVGIYYEAVHRVPWATTDVPAEPDEPSCHARLTLRKAILQLLWWRPDIWYVSRSGANLGPVVSDIRRSVEIQAIPWLAAMSDPARAVAVFEGQRERYAFGSIAIELLGGNLHSLARTEVVSALAFVAGDRSRASRAWEALLANPYYAQMSEPRKRAMAAIGMLSRP